MVGIVNGLASSISPGIQRRLHCSRKKLLLILLIQLDTTSQNLLLLVIIMHVGDTPYNS